MATSNAYAEEPALTDPPEEAAKCESDIPADCPQPAPEPAPMPEPAPAPAPVYTTDVEVYEEPEEEWYDTMGIGLSIGGGVDDFVGDTFRAATSLGGSWNVRATFGTRSIFALEGSYIGSAQNIDMGFDVDDATLVGNGLQAAARLNVLPDLDVQPFLYAGAAWRHYDVSTDSALDFVDIEDSDDVFELPVGIGVAGYVGGLMADVRAEYRGAWGNDLIDTFDIDDDSTIVGSADRWGVTGSLGAEF
ncbi:MAG TPA: hypothetical protein VIV11_41260 [Kofleriaceae bacterium]